MKLPFFVVAFLAALVTALLPALARCQTEPSYVLGPEDVVTVAVVDQPKFSAEFVIPESGIVSLPAVGELKVSGMSLESLRSTVLEALKKRLVHPEVNVSLKSARPKRVYVFGDVRNPGVLELKAGWRAREALSAAGGLSEGIQAADVRVTVERSATGEKRDVSLDEALNLGDPLLAGDVLRVSAAATIPVYVTGRVKTPGVYRIREREAGVLSALAQAGGSLEDANLSAVRIVRLQGGETTVDLTGPLVRGEPASGLPSLGSGDMVVVSESQDRFAVLGFVNKPGFYAIPSGKAYTLSEAVALAAGNDKRGRLSRVGVIRLENGKETRMVYDLGKYLAKGDAKQNPFVRSGDVIYVPETPKADLSQILSGIASTSLIFSRLFVP